MQFCALDIIGDAYERCNRLSPGETLNADDAALGFRRLNLLVDEMSARLGFRFLSLLTSADQTGHIALGAGAWSALNPGDVILSASVNGWPMTPLTMQQYNGLFDQTTIGTPRHYTPDGLGTVFLYPVPNGQTIRLETRQGIGQFADQNATFYTAPPGFKSALGAGLAVRIAPNTIGGIPQSLLDAERKCMEVIGNYMPAIIDSDGFNTGMRRFNILAGYF